MSSCIDDLLVPPPPVGTVYVMRLTDNTKQSLYDFVSWARSYSTVLIACFEISRTGQEHLHMVFIPLKTKSTFIQQMHVAFGERYKGNKSYSCEQKKKDLVNNYIYLCKGTRFKEPEIIFKIASITNDMVLQYWKHYWSDKPIDADKTISTKPKKNASPTWSEELTKTIQNDRPNYKWEYCAEDVNDLYKYVLKHLGKSSKKLSPIIVRDFVYGQLNALTDGECCQMRKKFQQEMFPDLFGSFDFEIG